MPSRKAQWRQHHYSLPKNHQWQAQPGNLLFVIDRGKAILEIPAGWDITPGDTGSVRILDRPEPHTCMGLEISIIHAPPADWSGLPLPRLLEDCYIKPAAADIISHTPFQQWQRPEDQTHAVWTEAGFHDENENRPALQRVCLGRGPGVHCLITMNFWPEDAGRAAEVWNSAMNTLKLGSPILKPDGSRQFNTKNISRN